MVLVCCIYSCRRTARVSPNYRALRTVHSTCSSISGTAENGCAACAAWLGCLMPQFIYRVDSSVCECCCVLGFSRVAMSRTVQSSVIQHEEYLESSMAFISQIAVNRAVAHPPGRYWSWSPIWSISPYLWGYQGFLHTYGGAKNWRNTTTVSIVTAYTVPRIFQKKKKKERGFILRSIPWIPFCSGSMVLVHYWTRSGKGTIYQEYSMNCRIGLLYTVCCHWSGSCSIFCPVWEWTVALVRINKYLYRMPKASNEGIHENDPVLL